MKVLKPFVYLFALAIGIFVGASVSGQSPLPHFILNAQTQIVATISLSDGQVVTVPIDLLFVTRSEQEGAYMALVADPVQPANAIVVVDDSKPISASVSAIVYDNVPTAIAVVPPTTAALPQVTVAPEQVTVATTNTQVLTSTAAPTQSAEGATYGIGDEVMTGDINWRVIAVDDLGNQLTSDNDAIEDATTEGRFIRVLFEIDNRGSEPLPYWEPELLDSQDRTFDTLSERFYFIPDEQECLLLIVEPGLPKQCVEIYEVADDAQGLKLKVTDFGLIYGNEAIINLQ